MARKAASETPQSVMRTYLTLTLLSTLATSLIWGVNTLFLLDAGLSNAQAFTVNAFFTAGQVLFEIPTGVVADTRGRATSYQLGAGTLLISTLLYLYMWQTNAPLWGWALASILIGLGFTFFSGAVEAWLVDALNATGFTGNLESVFGKGQVVAGAAMLIGSVSGGVVAQATNLGVPYIIRAAILTVTLAFALVRMRDLGFSPERQATPTAEVRKIWTGTMEAGFANPAVRWMMLASPFVSGAGVFAFYAMQPYLLELYGDETAYGIAGLAAAIVAGAQIIGGLLVPVVQRVFRMRSSVFILGSLVSVVALLGMGLTSNFWVAVGLLATWALMSATSRPIRQAFINGCIPSEQRATVLSFDALLGSSGGVVSQPLLGRAADVWSYSTSYLFASAITAAAMPFYLLTKRERSAGDEIRVAV